MQLEGGKITGAQLTSLITGFVIGSAILLAPARGAGHDAWLALLAAMLGGILIVLPFIALGMRFPGKTPIEYFDIVYGPYLGKVFSIMMLWYWFHLGALVLRNFGDFFTTAIMPLTPIWVFLGLTALVCASAVRNGIEVITRCSPILIVFFVATFLLTLIMVLPKMDINHFFPIFDVPLGDFFKATQSAMAFPFGETVAFLMFIPFLQNTKTARHVVLWGIVAGGILLTIASIRNIGALGPVIEIVAYPSLKAVRLIDIADIFSRVEIIVVINLLTLGFIKITVLYYATVLGTAQLLKLRTYLPLVFPIGLMMVILSIVQFDSIMENFVFAEKIYPYYGIMFQLVIPLVTLAVAAIRGLPKKQRRFKPNMQ